MALVGMQIIRFSILWHGEPSEKSSKGIEKLGLQSDKKIRFVEK